MSAFSPLRVWAMLCKEFLQLRRDRVTYAMILALPVVQLLIFGYAINNDPHHLPTAVLAFDESALTRSLVSAMERTAYMDVRYLPRSREEMTRLMRTGRIYLGVTIPPDFSHRVLKGDRPHVLVEVDAADPIAAAPALAALQALPETALSRELKGPAGSRQIPWPAVRRSSPQLEGPLSPPFTLDIHRLYNPENITSYNIVPGILGIVLSITLVMMTALSVTRERERGTMESLLATPLTPLEMLIGKLTPYVLIGLLQTVLILVLSDQLFNVPMPPSSAGGLALSSGVLLFTLGNLTLGYCLSTFARNQLQAVQLSIFYIMPSFFLSGFAFPFVGMPAWAQAIGEIIPITHFLRVMRGTLLKNQNLADMAFDMAVLAAFVLVVAALAVLRSQKTLD